MTVNFYAYNSLITVIFDELHRITARICGLWLTAGASVLARYAMKSLFSESYNSQRVPRATEWAVQVVQKPGCEPLDIGPYCTSV